ncbi:MAG TPA: MBL fold metallo-hydrolase [Terriglobales bacterium]|jgi:beta-lactamase superfamily II metal-dependent hydrolase|nr:MBL fold metallo-hydrolase [Terriglobales bacterium]
MMTRGFLAFFLALSVAAAPAVAQTHAARTFDIYVTDMEGGNSTLFVSPSGESVLIDTGSGSYPGTNAADGRSRDVDRILEAVEDAGLKQIDYLITTHWHGDHFGGLAELARRIPVRHFIDHGPQIVENDRATEFLRDVYPKLYEKATRTIAKPGDKIPVAGLDWRVVSSAGVGIKTPLPGAGAPNPYCASYKPIDEFSDGEENAASVASVVTFGRFRVAHMGDMTQSREFKLMCPNNKVGTIDLLVVSHHGLAVSNSEALVHALHPRVAVMNNGTRKGGPPEVMKVLYTSPGLEDLWQMHFSVLSGQEYTVPGLFIANMFDDQPPAMPINPVPQPPRGGPPAPAHNGKAYWIKVSAQSDGTFTVTNGRNQFSKTYKTHK